MVDQVSFLGNNDCTMGLVVTVRRYPLRRLHKTKECLQGKRVRTDDRQRPMTTFQHCFNSFFCQVLGDVAPEIPTSHGVGLALIPGHFMHLAQESPGHDVKSIARCRPPLADSLRPIACGSP